MKGGGISQSVDVSSRVQFGGSRHGWKLGLSPSRMRRTVWRGRGRFQVFSDDGERSTGIARRTRSGRASDSGGRRVWGGRPDGFHGRGAIAYSQLGSCLGRERSLGFDGNDRSDGGRPSDRCGEHGSGPNVPGFGGHGIECRGPSRVDGPNRCQLGTYNVDLGADFRSAERSICRDNGAAKLERRDCGGYEWVSNDLDDCTGRRERDESPGGTCTLTFP